MSGPAATETIHTLHVDSDLPQRLDKFLTIQLPAHSRARLQALIKTGQVRVNGKLAAKSGQLLMGGELIEVRVLPAEPSDLIPEDIALDVVFENEDVIVVNKPAGMVVHPAAGHSHGTLINAALSHAPEIEGIGGELRPGLVHRLDKDTSGLIILAKNESTQRVLQEQFQNRTIEKTYIALVDGRPSSPSGRIDAPIGRDPRERKRMAVVRAAKGRVAVSEYRIVEEFPKHTLLEVNPHTGRTHQIRVHLAFIHCPVVGDHVYGHRNPSLPVARQFLHAARLGLRLPGEAKMRYFQAPLPADLQEVLDSLRTRVTEEID
jgi:23S rRNA pseudouridine1911/1915/1917 synthase